MKEAKRIGVFRCGCYRGESRKHLRSLIGSRPAMSRWNRPPRVNRVIETKTGGKSGKDIYIYHLESTYIDSEVKKVNSLRVVVPFGLNCIEYPRLAGRKLATDDAVVRVLDVRMLEFEKAARLLGIGARGGIALHARRRRPVSPARTARKQVDGRVMDLEKWATGRRTARVTPNLRRRATARVKGPGAASAVAQSPMDRNHG